MLAPEKTLNSNALPQITAVVGPSGAGKDALISGALARRPDLHWARRVITRPADDGHERHEAVDLAEFARRERSGMFAVSWTAHGLHYGIPWSELSGPNPVILNGSRRALNRMVTVLPEVVVLLVTAPVAVIAARLAARGRESEADIAARLKTRDLTLPEGIRPRLVVNDGTLEQGVERFLQELRLDKA